MYYSKIIIKIITLSCIVTSCGKKQLTFNDDISTIIHQKCAICHHQNGAGPFELITYQDVKKRIDMIEFVVQNNYMPPWPADPEYRHFSQEKCLNKEDKRNLLKWIKLGASNEFVINHYPIKIDFLDVAIIQCIVLILGLIVTYMITFSKSYYVSINKL